jgi:Trypsin
MFKKLSLLVVLLALVALVGSASAITWGTADGNAHPQVVGLLFERPDGLYSCTGTLLTPYVVLTAGHCTEELGQRNLYTWVRNDADLDAVYAAERPLYPAGAAGRRQYLNERWTPGAAIPHPNYADYATFPNTYDIGVILLERPIYVANYGQLPTLNQFAFLDNQRGSNNGDRIFLSVGYGRQQIVPVSSEATRNEWVRRQATSSLINTRSNNTRGFNFQFSENPGNGNGSGGTCFGDSGGPQFYGNSLVVGSVTSFGITGQCNGNGFSYRTDIADSQNFVRPLLGWVAGNAIP